MPRLAEHQTGNAAKLYTPSVLALSVELAAYPHRPDDPIQGFAKSRTCGSELLLSGSGGCGDDLGAIGMTVTACAVGQASAALFADYAKGRSSEEIEATAARMEAWISGEASSEFLPRLDLLEPARGFSARHGAILLPWRAAIDALSTGTGSR